MSDNWGHISGQMMGHKAEMRLREAAHLANADSYLKREERRKVFAQISMVIRASLAAVQVRKPARQGHSYQPGVLSE